SAQVGRHLRFQRLHIRTEDESAAPADCVEAFEQLFPKLFILAAQIHHWNTCHDLPPRYLLLGSSAFSGESARVVHAISNKARRRDVCPVKCKYPRSVSKPALACTSRGWRSAG